MPNIHKTTTDIITPITFPKKERNIKANIKNKISTIRIFEEDDRMNKNLHDVGGQVLLVSNFTLCTKETSGARPDFTLSADRDVAKNLYEQLASELDLLNVPVKMGVFGADMQIDVHLDGPITIYKEIKNSQQI